MFQTLDSGMTAYVETQHLDGLHVEETHGNLLSLTVVEQQNGVVTEDCFTLTAPDKGDNQIKFARLGPLVRAMCDYFNAGGDFDEFDAVSLRFHEFIHEVQFPKPGRLIALQDSQLRTLYYQVGENQYLKVVPGMFSLPLTSEELEEELGRDIAHDLQELLLK